MKPRLVLLLLGLGFTHVSAVANAQTSTAASPVASPTPIFNGRDLKGWKLAEPNPFWRVEQGLLIGENDEPLTGSVLWSEKSYGDFVLEFEVRWTGVIDSGVMLRKPELQLQIGQSASLKRDMTGSFYTGTKGAVYPEHGQAKEGEKQLKPGEWNAFRLEARGTTFTVWINGHQVSQFTDPKYAEPAPIGLQIHPKLKMKVEFRNLRMAALP
jgi:hypothetical protein